MTLYRLYLTTGERQTLEGWRQKYKSHSPKLRQMQILLTSDEHTGRRTSRCPTSTSSPTPRTIPSDARTSSPNQLMEQPTFVAANGQRCHDSAYVRRGRVVRGHRSAAWLARVVRRGRPPRRRVGAFRGPAPGHDLPRRQESALGHGRPGRTQGPFFLRPFPPDVARVYPHRTEIEFAVLGRQALNRPFADKAAVQAAVERWKNWQNTKPKPRNWQFTTVDARIKPARLYPTTQCFSTTSLPLLLGEG